MRMYPDLKKVISMWISTTFFLNNLGQKICRLFHFLAQLVFTTSEMELDYYHQKVNVRVASRIAEWLKTKEIREL